MSNKYPLIYIICHKLDYFLTKIAVASIHYYYPDVEINLIKDELNGNFSTKDLEKYFNVNVVHLEKRKFGWTSAKVFLLLSKKLKGQKILMLDSDTVFVGEVLDKITPDFQNYEFLVSPEFSNKPGQTNFTSLYYNYDLVKKDYPRLTYPGFTFNTGCIGITAGSFHKDEIRRYFNPESFPFWTTEGEKMLPTRDQSLMNILLPLKVKTKQLKWKHILFMWWFGENEVKQLLLSEVKNGKHAFVIHWAGGKKLPFLPAMTRSDILFFFQQRYYASLPFGKIRFYINLLKESTRYFTWTYPKHITGIEKISEWTK